MMDGMERSPFGTHNVLRGDVRSEPEDEDKARAFLARKGLLGLTEMLGL